jgi:hypothetical protein
VLLLGKKLYIYDHMSGHVGVAKVVTPCSKGAGSRSLCAGMAFLLADKGKTMAFGAYH